MQVISWRAVKGVVMFKRTIFSLTWVLAGAILAFTDQGFATSFDWTKWDRWLWIVLGVFTARTSAMAFNALIDRKMDALNPRTQARILPSGEATPWQVAILAVVSLVAFFVVCAQINEVCLAFAPFIALLLWAYSYTKRFTAWCHFALGVIYLFGPVMAWAAVTGMLSGVALCLGIAFCLLITTNDIIYGLQDREFDVAYGVNSIPAALGREWAMALTRFLYAGCFFFLVVAGLLLPAGRPPFLGFVACVGIMFLADQMGVQQLCGEALRDRFARSNTLAGLLVFAGSIGAVLWPG